MSASPPTAAQKRTSPEVAEGPIPDLLRRMRQRPGMVEHLTEIAAIEPATARVTPDVVLRFLGRRAPAAQAACPDICRAERRHLLFSTTCKSPLIRPE